jgi:hypothetical protein
METTQFGLVTRSFDPSSLNFVEVQGILSSLEVGFELVNGGPAHMEKQSSSRTDFAINNMQIGVIKSN